MIKCSPGCKLALSCNSEYGRASLFGERKESSAEAASSAPRWWRLVDLSPRSRKLGTSEAFACCCRTTHTYTTYLPYVMHWPTSTSSGRNSADTMPDTLSEEEEVTPPTMKMIGLVQHPNTLRGHNESGVAQTRKTVYLKDDVLSPSSGGYFL